MTLREKRVGSSGNWEWERGEEREGVTCVISHCLLQGSSITKTEFWKSTSLIWIHNSVSLQMTEKELNLEWHSNSSLRAEHFHFSFEENIYTPKSLTETFGSSAVARASTYLFHSWLSTRPAGWEWNSELHPEYNACFRWNRRHW